MVTILAAVIPPALAAVSAIVVALIAHSNQRKAEAKVDRVELKTVEATRQFEEAMLSRFGFKARLVRDVRTIVNLDGNVSIGRTYEGVEVANEGITLTYIPTRVWVTPGEIAGSPELVHTGPFAKRVELSIQRADKDHCEFRVEVAGGLTKRDGPLSYGFRALLHHGAVMTKEEMDVVYGKDAFKYEYVCFDVDFPIDLLELVVEFPDKFEVDCFAGVFLGYSECIQQVELDRAKGGLAKGPTGGATFRIENPLLGFRYAIYWAPPLKKDIDKLRGQTTAAAVATPTAA